MTMQAWKHTPVPGHPNMMLLESISDVVGGEDPTVAFNTPWKIFPEFFKGMIGLQVIVAGGSISGASNNIGVLMTLDPNDPTNVATQTRYAGYFIGPSAASNNVTATNINASPFFWVGNISTSVGGAATMLHLCTGIQFRWFNTGVSGTGKIERVQLYLFPGTVV